MLPLAEGRQFSLPSAAPCPTPICSREWGNFRSDVVDVCRRKERFAKINSLHFSSWSLHWLRLFRQQRGIMLNLTQPTNSTISVHGLTFLFLCPIIEIVFRNSSESMPECHQVCYWALSNKTPSQCDSWLGLPLYSKGAWKESLLLVL